MIENILSESHGTSLFGLDDIIKQIYLDLHNKIEYYYDENLYIDNIYNNFDINNINIKFLINSYSIKFKLNNYFNNISKNYDLIINVFDIIDDKFSKNFEKYKNVLEDYDGYTDIDNNKIVLNLTSYNKKINSKAFFIICTHELQHLYTVNNYKKINNLEYISNLSYNIQNYIQKLNITKDEKKLLIDLFYILFDANEISSYSSQFYGELLSKLKNRKFKTRLSSDLLIDTDTEKLLNTLSNKIDFFESFSSEKLFLLCEYIFTYNEINKINNKFSNSIYKLYKTNNKNGFKTLLLKIFRKNYNKLRQIINKIASNYYLCESKYPYLDHNFKDKRLIFKDRKTF